MTVQALKRRYWKLRESAARHALFVQEAVLQLACWVGTALAAARLVARRKLHEAGIRALPPIADRRIVLVSYFSPPYKSAYGTQRWGKFLKFLERQGWETHLVTTAPRPEDVAPDPEPLPAGIGVVRLPKRVLQHPAFVRRPRAVPEPVVPWVFEAYRATVATVRRSGASIIAATVPPYSNLLVGTMAAATLRMPLVADFRDPWSKVSAIGWVIRQPILRRLNATLERLCLASADQIIIVDDLTYLEDFFDQVNQSLVMRTTRIPNGYDEEDFRALEPDGALLDGPKFVVSYVGTIYDRETLSNLVEPFRAWHSVAPDEVADALFVYAGFNDSVVAATPFPCEVRVHSYLSHRDSLRLRLSSHAQLFSVPPTFKPHFMSGKLYEILRAGPPVVARVLEGSGPAKLIRRLDAGYVVPQGNHAAAATALRNLYHDWRAGRLPSSRRVEGIEEFDRGRQAGTLSLLLEGLIARDTLNGEIKPPPLVSSTFGRAVSRTMGNRR